MTPVTVAAVPMIGAAVTIKGALVIPRATPIALNPVGVANAAPAATILEVMPNPIDIVSILSATLL